MQTVVKLANRRVLNRYWLSFLPEWAEENTVATVDRTAPPELSPPLASGGVHTLLTSLERELVPHTRCAALYLLATLLDGAKSFLMSAGVFVGMCICS